MTALTTTQVVTILHPSNPYTPSGPPPTVHYHVHQSYYDDNNTTSGHPPPPFNGNFSSVPMAILQEYFLPSSLPHKTSRVRVRVTELGSVMVPIGLHRWLGFGGGSSAC